MKTSSTWQLDALDLKILDILQGDGRITNTRLAAQVGLSESACFGRLRKLENKHMIQAYRAEVSQVRLGSLITVMVEVTIEKHKAHEHARFEQVISGEPEVVECAAVTGPFDYLLKIIARDIEGYVAVMDRIAAKYERISNYVSHVVIRQVKHSPLLASHAVRLAAPSSVEK